MADERTHRKLEHALLRLPECERALLCLVAVQGHTYRDAAVRLGIDERTAAMHLRAALHQLRRDPSFGELFARHTPDLA